MLILYIIYLNYLIYIKNKYLFLFSMLFLIKILILLIYIIKKKLIKIILLFFIIFNLTLKYKLIQMEEFQFYYYSIY